MYQTGPDSKHGRAGCFVPVWLRINHQPLLMCYDMPAVCRGMSLLDTLDLLGTDPVSKLLDLYAIPHFRPPRFLVPCVNDSLAINKPFRHNDIQELREIDPSYYFICNGRPAKDTALAMLKNRS